MLERQEPRSHQRLCRRAMMADIRCLLPVLNCHASCQQLLKNDHTSRLIFRSKSFLFSDAENISADPVTLNGSL